VCDLECSYCNAVEDTSSGPVLAVEEIGRLAEAAVLAGARTVRLTGGEPLLRDDIEGIVSRVRKAGSVAEIALTTNAQRLAAEFRAAFDRKPVRHSRSFSGSMRGIGG
jgi:cyclic pyranopterin phosphate synthase